MTKLLWHMQDKKDSYWIRWVHHFYIKRESMWTWNPLKSASPMIKYLMSIRDKLVINCGTIDKAKFSLDLSLAQSVIVNLLGRPCHLRHRWATWACQTQVSLALPMISLDHVSSKSLGVSHWVLSKHPFILWLAILGCLYINDRIIDFMEIDSKCFFSKLTQIGWVHLFFSCPFSKSIWTMVRNWSGTLREMSTLIITLKCLKKKNGWALWIAMFHRHTLDSTIYFIWHTIGHSSKVRPPICTLLFEGFKFMHLALFLLLHVKEHFGLEGMI